VGRLRATGATVWRLVSDDTWKRRRRQQPSKRLARHSGMVRRTRPGISRSRVRCSASPRD